MTEKQFLMIYIMVFLAGLFLIYLIGTRMENKVKKVRSKKVNHRNVKIDVCRNLVANLQQDFIGERKMIFNELVRM